MNWKPTIVFFAILTLVLMSVSTVSEEITDISITAPTGGEYWSGSQDITWTETGDTSTVEIAYSDDDFDTLNSIATEVAAGTLTQSWDTTGPDDGTYRVIVYVTGNQAVNATSGEFTVDNTPPTYTVSYSKNPVKDGDEVTITVTFNEDMDAGVTPQIALAATSGDPDTVAATDLTRVSATVYNYSWTVGTGNGVLTPEVTVGEDLAGNLVTNDGSTRTTVTVDNTRPTVDSATTGDANANGRIDRIVVVYSEPVVDVGYNAVSVAGYTINASASSGSGTATLIYVLEEGSFDTQVTPGLTWTEANAQDLAGNDLNESGAPSNAADGAPPVIVDAVTDSTTTIIITWSENVDVSTTDGEGFTLSEGTVSANTNPAGSSPTMTLTVSAMGTGDTPNVIYTESEGSVVDAATVPNAALDQTFEFTEDGVPPTFTAVRNTMGTIVLTFSETGIQSTSTAVGAFSLDTGTVVSWSITGADEITIVTSGLMGTDDTPTVTYNTAAGANVRDSQDNEVVDSTSAVAQDGVAPIVVSVVAMPDELTIASATVQIVVTFSEAMDTSVVPDITFSDGVWTAVAPGEWTVGDTVFTRSFTAPEGLEAEDVDVIVDGAEDVAGNAMADPYTEDDQIDVDTLAPTLTLVSIASDNVNSEYAKVGDTVTLTFTASETIQTPTIFIDGSGTPPPTNTVGNTWVATRTMQTDDNEGVITFSINFQDEVGNPGSEVTATTDASEVTFDETDPTINVTTPVQDSLYGSFQYAFVLNGTGSDIDTDSIDVSLWGPGPSLIESYGFADLSCVDSGMIVTCEGSESIADGTYMVMVSVSDLAGNSNTESIENVAIDSSVPVISHTNSLPPGVYSQDWIFANVTMSGPMLDTVVIRLYRNGVLNQTSVSAWDSFTPLNYTDLSEGVYEVNGTLNNTDGVEVDLASRVYTLDTTPPAVVIDRLDPWETSSNLPQIFFTVTDNLAETLECELLFDDVGYGVDASVMNDTSSDIIANTTVDDGTYSVTIHCIDDAGNPHNDTITVTVDTTAPSIVFVSPVDGSGTNETDVELEVNITDLGVGISNVEYRIVNGTNASHEVVGRTALPYVSGDIWGDTLDFSAYDEWSYTIQVFANDTLNNNDTVSVTISFDETPPNITSFTCGNVVRNAAHACTYSVTDNSEAWDGELTVAISADTSTVGTGIVATITVTDEAGNEATATTTFSVTSPPSSGGGGGGGSSSSAPPGIGIAASVSQGKVNLSRAGVWYWSGIRPNEQVKLDVSAREMPVKELVINPRSAVNNLQIMVGEVEEGRHPETSRPRGQVYKYMEIIATPSVDDAVESIVISFSVPMDWISAQGAAPEDIVMHRFVAPNWVALQTRYLRTENGEALYEATTPGLSYFAIAATESPQEAPVETTEPPAPISPPEEPPVVEPVPPEPTAVVPEPEERRFNWMLLFGVFVLIVIIVVAGLFLYNKRNRYNFGDYDDEYEAPKEEAHEEHKKRTKKK